jgi:membrane protease YdiL (CAAX protease family)
MIIDDTAPIELASCNATPRTKQRDVFEILAIYGMILLLFWTPRPWQYLVLSVASATIFFIIAGSSDGFRQMGFSRGNLSCSVYAVVVSLAVAAIAVMLAVRMHTFHVSGTAAAFIRHSCLYAAWAAIQEIVLQCFFLSRLLRVLGRSSWAAAAAATLFALAHLPSPILMVITLVCGLAGCLFFLRYRSLYPIAIAHAILGIVIAVTVPVSLDHNMQVGLGYLTWADSTAPLSHTARLPQP